LQKSFESKLLRQIANASKIEKGWVTSIKKVSLLCFAKRSVSLYFLSFKIKFLAEAYLALPLKSTFHPDLVLTGLAAYSF
jgi:hypothetical protein